MTATMAGQDYEIYPGGGTVAVVGEDDAVSDLVAEVLSRHRCHVVRHHSPDELLDGLPEAPEAPAPPAQPAPAPSPNASAPAAAGEGEPSLYIFNCQLSGLGRASRRSAGAWWHALKALSKRAPGTAILVVIGPGEAQGLIKRALQAGADEILRADDAEIEELVWARVQSALARANPAFRAAPAMWSISIGAAPQGLPRRTGERRRGERRGAGPGTDSPPPAAPRAGDVVESWDEPATPDEIRAAHERVRAALGSLPTHEDRRGPYADLLDVSVPALRAASGRLDAKKIADHLGVSLASLARISAISRQALNETPDSVRAQQALDPLARTLHVLGTVLSPEHVRAWLNAPHARLGGETPIHAILHGRAEQVARMLERARDGGVD